MKSRCYRLSCETLAVEQKNQNPLIVTLPEGSRVIVADAKAGSRMIDVLWEGKMVALFTQDLDERGVLEEETIPPVTEPPKSSHNTA